MKTLKVQFLEKGTKNIKSIIFFSLITSTNIFNLRALAFFFDCDLSKRDYEKMTKLMNKGRPSMLLPTYKSISNYKSLKCRPRGPEFFASHMDVSMPLQSVLDHTAGRILLDDQIEERVIQLAKENGGHLEITFYYKYGLDGSKVIKAGSYDSMIFSICFLTSRAIQFSSRSLMRRDFKVVAWQLILWDCKWSLKSMV